MPSFGSACMMPTSRRIAAAVMKLSVSSVTIEVVPVAPALAEIAEVAGLEAGVDRAPPVGDRNAALAIARPGRRRPVPRPRRYRAGWCRSARRGGSGPPTPAARQILASWRRDCGSPARAARCARTSRSPSTPRSGSSSRHAPACRHHHGDRIARKPHDAESRWRRSRSRSPTRAWSARTAPAARSRPPRSRPPTASGRQARGVARS